MMVTFPGHEQSVDTAIWIVGNSRAMLSRESTRHSIRRNMRNDLNRAAYWIAFILERCQFPNRDALAAQFANAEIGELWSMRVQQFRAIDADDSGHSSRHADTPMMSAPESVEWPELR
ncbi:hypothetical protein DIE19_00345 [Burkholderia sp. Bp9126]|nr:hypothetical protein DIE19_00345 [Burkholderia sp. Bp9126]